VPGGDHFLAASMSRWHGFAREAALGLLGVRELPADVREALESTGRADRAR